MCGVIEKKEINLNTNSIVFHYQSDYFNIKVNTESCFLGIYISYD